MNDTGIRPEVIEEIRNLAQKYDIEKVILFGSRARGDFRRTSDIDIAVTGGDFARFALDVDEETSTLLEYDIVNLDRDMQDELRESIEKCISCGKCKKVCPMNVDITDNSRKRKNGTECILCMECVRTCPRKAL